MVDKHKKYTPALYNPIHEQIIDAINTEDLDKLDFLKKMEGIPSELLSLGEKSYLHIKALKGGLSKDEREKLEVLRRASGMKKPSDSAPKKKLL